MYINTLGVVEEKMEKIKTNVCLIDRLREQAGAVQGRWFHDLVYSIGSVWSLCLDTPLLGLPHYCYPTPYF
jgi:hypothetical protein